MYNKTRAPILPHMYVHDVVQCPQALEHLASATATV